MFLFIIASTKIEHQMVPFILSHEEQTSIYQNQCTNMMQNDFTSVK